MAAVPVSSPISLFSSSFSIGIALAHRSSPNLALFLSLSGRFVSLTCLSEPRSQHNAQRQPAAAAEQAQLIIGFTGAELSRTVCLYLSVSNELPSEPLQKCCYKQVPHTHTHTNKLTRSVPRKIMMIFKQLLSFSLNSKNLTLSHFRADRSSLCANSSANCAASLQSELISDAPRSAGDLR